MTMRFSRPVFSLLLAATLCLPLGAQAAAKHGVAPIKPAVAAQKLPVTVSKGVPKPADNKADIARVEAYLTALSTITADFSQTAANGDITGGKFYLKRPGKMRWQYSAPSNVQLVSNGSTIVYYDPAVEQVSYVPVDDTMAGFLAQKDMRLEGSSTHLAKFESANSVIRATLVQRKKPTEGSLTLEFSDNPLQLRQMQVADATGQITAVQLQNAQFGTPLEESLFKFIDPRGVIPRRNK